MTMATKRTNKVEVEITAIDEASPKIDRLEKKIDGLESDEARIVVTANTARLERQLDEAKAKLDGLDGDEATVQARLIGTLEQDLEQARTLLSQLDGKSGTVRINAAGDAKRDLDRVETQLRELDGRTARVSVDTTGAGVEGGAGGLIGVGKGAAGVVAGLGIADQLLDASKLVLQVQAVAEMTGATHEEASKAVAVWQAQGFEVGDLLDLLSQVNSVLRQNPELADKLGVKIGTNQSLIETFLQSVEGVATAYDNAGERADAASQLFGEQGTLQVGLVKAAVGDLRTAIEQTPPITSEDDLERMQEMNRQAANIKNNLQIARQEAARIAIPGVETTLATGDINKGIFASTVAAISALIDHFGGVGGGGSRMGPSIEDIVAANTGGFYGGAFGAIRAPVGTSSHVPPGGYRITNIYPPPGSPPITADTLRLYEERNGPR
jgi:hypothetical protein